MKVFISIYMDFDSVSAAMKVCALDLLCVLPEDEVKPFGIPYLRSILEVGATQSPLEKWEKF